jgi:hypothetical protein
MTTTTKKTKKTETPKITRTEKFYFEVQGNGKYGQADSVIGFLKTTEPNKTIETLADNPNFKLINPSSTILCSPDSTHYNQKERTERPYEKSKQTFPEPYEILSYTFINN